MQFNIGDNVIIVIEMVTMLVNAHKEEGKYNIVIRDAIMVKIN